MNNLINQNKFLEIRVSKRTYILFSVMFGPFVLAGLIAIYLSPPSNDWILAPIGFGFFLSCFFFNFFAMRIRIYSNKIVYKTFFKTREIFFPKIYKAKIRIEPSSSGYYHLDLLDRKKYTAKKPFDINIKPFNKYDLSILAKAILDKTQNAKIDSEIKSLAKNDIKPIVRQGIKGIWKVAILIFFIMLVSALIRAIFFK